MIENNMAKKEGSGIQQQAGLIRYFDTENDKALKISPKVVIGIAIGVSIGVLLLHIFYPM
ncbi:MAG: preprotein translocase subunit Sec61beta [Methanomassiliicoccaceae archaeon]|jgi:preprotein translocase subunit Sec61beta|nr:preprotein translocase subunit Sec61beta [Methanomassiliicoccaceae archaeon]